MPKVSIVVPTYNYGHLIGETLAAISRQSFSDWECLVVDDGSGDNTAEVVSDAAKGDSRIVFIPREHQGPSHARNGGIAQAKGEYLQFLDSDDVLEPAKLERQTAFLDAHPEIEIVYSDVRYFRDDKPEERTLSWDGGSNDWTQRISASGDEAVAALLRANITTIHAPLVRRALVQKIGGFDEKMSDAEDWDLWLRAALAGGRFHYEAWPDTLALVRSHRGSTSRNRARMLGAELYMRRKIDGELNAGMKSLNETAIRDAEFRLRLEKAMEETTPFRRFRRLLQTGAGHGGARGILHALALPLARSPIMRGKVRSLRDALRRPDSAS